MDAHFRTLTAEGRGAIAVVRVSGPDALEAADSVFRPHRGRPLAATAPGRLRLGRAGVGVGDEVIAVRLDEATPAVEIQCHGGAAAVAAVVRALEAAGAVRDRRDPSAVSRAEDRIRAQAMEDLASAPTLRVAEILLDQFHGALSRALEGLASGARAGAGQGPSPVLLETIDGLLRRGDVGTRLLRGWEVVIAGRPNVGKSRLFNALAGFERSIVNPTAGVTRDVVTLRAAFGGWPVELSDTAGERDSEDAVERLGIGRARRRRGDADLVLLVVDRSEPMDLADRGLLASTPSGIVVANKGDLPPAWETDLLERGGREVYPVSAETGEGLDLLIGAIGSRLVPIPPEPGAAVPFRGEHLRGLERARDRAAAGDLERCARQLEEILRPPGSA